MTRSPALERVCAAAVAHFSERSYDGGSLSEIAEAVGIRKASLYSHFASKDALFLAAYGEALQVEQAFVRQSFAAEAPKTAPGSRYCASLAQRYGESQHLRLLLRTAYVPPQALVAAVDEGYEDYLGVLQGGFEARLKVWPQTAGRLSGADLRLYGQAYLAIVDSLHVKLVYTNGKDVGTRLKAMQRLLGDSLRLTTG
ncbi:TetR/AcrR family transcriptional regulator [Bordetella trematum]|uniref:TetR/AcrR family transcriptional regulator n=1 Tax=Bordetella trematum TaxID=123899 RepID=UPI000D80633A|nr:helix-turn-helix domain-containing protein [Bordetella trematum]SPU49736.1 TetR family transcriptional regulator [Bordetella trematum]VDH07486.1 Intercellular adhesion protein R [Bordetella trematum]